MAKQKFGLGRGLDALISGASEVMAPQQPSQVDAEAITELPVDRIIPNPRQPRKAFREDDPRLLGLSASIKEHGLLQPIIVARLDSINSPKEAAKQADSWFSGDADKAAHTPSPEGDAIQYQIIAGERRWRAARLAGLHRVPVVIKEVTSQQMLEIALIENIQRADLNPIEEALAYQALIQEFSLTQEMVAKRVGKDRSTITNSLRLLQLSPKVRDALINQPDNFTEGHARALVGIAREEDQITAMNQVISQHLNVRQTEELAARIKAAEDIESAIQRVTNSPRRSPEQEELETLFRNALMVKVDLKWNAKGKGTLVLHFNDPEELENLYSRLVKREE
ncbi:MAG TPA: ParB/RepB/Spo0J family partition protein [Ktedonobacteraceae bacterium]|nr:ParB/RepB/Spo0J family partition protein [Ktedonobacteraceae bacterium]